MRLILKGIKSLEYDSVFRPNPHVKEGWRRLRVLFSAICRTDAKMWASGHRDLVMPRVLGHELAAIDEITGKKYTIWPGISCNSCSFCSNGRENLCDSMKIIGFHNDGGFSTYIDVPPDSLLPSPNIIDPKILCFAEPVACILSSLRDSLPFKEKKVLIYGGGVLGSLAALICSLKGSCVTVLEKSEEKIQRTEDFRSFSKYDICKQTNEADFDIAINCCDSFIAFSQAITKLKKTGSLIFFSGLKKNKEIDTNVLNLLHYKELELFGSYGPVKKNMEDAVEFCAEHSTTLSKLIEKVILPAHAEKALPAVLAGNSLKYIVDFTSADKNSIHCKNGRGLSPTKKSPHSFSFLTDILGNISCRGKTIKDQASWKIDNKSKPLGALGRLEQLAVQLCCIQNTLSPKIVRKKLIVFAGDHGIVEEGVSAYPSKVTAQMVKNFLDGGAAINIFCRKYGIDLKIADMGVNSDLEISPGLIDKKVAYGTKNFALQPAMSVDDVFTSLERGAETFLDGANLSECDVVGIGEMGIGNTTSATAIISIITGKCPSELTGRGTGIDDEGKRRKIEVLKKALALQKPSKNDPVDILSKVGGYEIAGMCGAILKAAEQNTAVVLDGLISTAAGLLCYIFQPKIKDFLIAGHKSVEKGQLAALAYMNIRPVIDLEMRLGEGTGAAIAIDMVDLSCKVIGEMATFDEAGISKRK